MLSGKEVLRKLMSNGKKNWRRHEGSFWLLTSKVRKSWRHLHLHRKLIESCLLNSKKVSRFLILVVGVGFLGSGSGCARDEPPPETVLKVPDIPKVRGALMRPVQKQGCLQPNKDNYSVSELVEGKNCLEDHIEGVEAQLTALQRAVKQREKLLGDLQKNKPAK